MKKSYIYNSPLGALAVVLCNGAVCSIGLAAEQLCSDAPCELWSRVECELNAYFAGQIKSFSFAVAPCGTTFQKRVWAELRNIPYGHTATYGEIAARIGNSKASRAVGMACNRNPVLLAVPCHRVVGANGKLTGFAIGLKRKEFLLRLEKEYRE